MAYTTLCNGEREHDDRSMRGKIGLSLRFFQINDYFPEDKE